MKRSVYGLSYNLPEGISIYITLYASTLPVYISYFAEGKKTVKTIRNAVALSLVFTVLVILEHLQVLLWFACEVFQMDKYCAGGIIVIFGLSYTGIIRLSFLSKSRNFEYKHSETGLLSSALFGVIFSIGWTPCVGAFMGSALMLAATSQESFKGVLMLLSFSMGLGIPFIISALILDKLKGVFNFIKRNYKVINIISGGLLIILGIAMMTGLLGKLLAVITF